MSNRKSPAAKVSQTKPQAPKTLPATTTTAPKKRGRPAKVAPLHANAGTPWTASQDQDLIKALANGASPAECATTFGRTLAGIEARMAHLVAKGFFGKGKESPQAAPQPAPAGSNGNHPKTLAAVASSPPSLSLVIPGHYSGEVPSLIEAQKQYRRLSSGCSPKFPDGAVYTNGTQTYTIKPNGDAYNMRGELEASGPSLKEAAKPQAEALEPATAVTVPVRYIAAALAVAAKKDTRYYLNGVYLHIVDGALRIAATDGHRILVISTAMVKDVPWGDDGVILPREELDRIVKYVGKAKGDEEPTALEISFGRHHPVIKIHEANGMGEFTLKPIDGKFPDYGRLLERAGDVMNSERKPTETTSLSSAYLKSAGAIAAQLESATIFPFIGATTADACAFTFAGEPGAILLIMPTSENKPALAAATVRLIGEAGMRGSLAALKAHETRCRKAAEEATKAKDSKESERQIALAQGFVKRADEIRAALAIKLAAPTAAPAAKPAEEVKPQA